MATSQEKQSDGEGSVRGSPQDEKAREQLYKVLVIGDFGVGTVTFSLDSELTNCSYVTS